MRIFLHIGLEHVGANRLQAVLAGKRSELAQQKVLYPKSPGNKNHTRLYMAVTDPDHVDPLRFNRGHLSPEKQARLYVDVQQGLAKDVAEAQPDTLILSAAQLGASLHRTSELQRLRDMLVPLSDDIRIVAHVDEPARLLTRFYANQVMEGRSSGLERELALSGETNWWHAALASAPEIDPAAGQFVETQTPPFWLDYKALVGFWEEVFGAGSVSLHSYDAARFAGPDVAQELAACFGLNPSLGRIGTWGLPVDPSAAWLARGRQLNASS